MSYVRTKIGNKETFIEFRFVHVPAGNPVPLPPAGYTISSKLYTIYGADFYLEYKEVDGVMTLI